MEKLYAWETGDVVIAKEEFPNVTQGEKYTILGVGKNRGCFVIKDDNGLEVEFNEYWFEPLDIINNPNHYHKNGIDVIKFAELQFSKEELKGFFRINALKYITRFDRKNGIEDLKKGLFYLNKLLEMEDGTNGQKDEKSHSVENI